jgi:hypothetical protein
LIYFISNGKSIKIGYTKGDPYKRLKQLSTGSSSPLYLLGYIKDADKKLEKELHNRFKRINLEWFFPSPDLLDYINKYNDMQQVYVDWSDDKKSKLVIYKTMKK